MLTRADHRGDAGRQSCPERLTSDRGAVGIENARRQGDRVAEGHRGGGRRDGHGEASHRYTDRGVAGERHEHQRDRHLGAGVNIDRHRSAVRFDGAGIVGAHHDGPVGAGPQYDCPGREAVDDRDIERHRRGKVGRGHFHDDARDCRAGEIRPHEQGGLDER